MSKERIEGAIEALEQINPMYWHSRADNILAKYRAQLAALPPEPAQPWTPRERRLREALGEHVEFLANYLKHLNNAAITEACEPLFRLSDAALADTPPPDARKGEHDATYTQVDAFEWIAKCGCGWSKRIGGKLDAVIAECDLHNLENNPRPPDARDEALERAEKIFKRLTLDVDEVRRAVDQQWVDRNDRVSVTHITRFTYGDVIDADDALAAIRAARGGE